MTRLGRVNWVHGLVSKMQDQVCLVIRNSLRSIALLDASLWLRLLSISSKTYCLLFSDPLLFLEMNNGQGNDHPLNRQIGFRVSDTVSPDVHARNQAQIQMYRNYIDEMERQNRIGLDRWYSEQERELQERVEAGRQAEYVRRGSGFLKYRTHRCDRRMLSQLKNQRGYVENIPTQTCEHLTLNRLIPK